MTPSSIPAAATSAIVLFAHGSRDPLWRRPVEDVARRIVQRAPDCTVRCAYLELTEPDLQTVVAELVARGCRSLRILPMFLGTGRHAREDLPALVAELRAAHPQLQIDLRASVGEDPRVLDALAQLALE